jgi:hypothetical protein
MILSSTIPPVGWSSAEREERNGGRLDGEKGVMRERNVAAPGPVSSCWSLCQS